MSIMRYAFTYEANDVAPRGSALCRAQASGGAGRPDAHRRRRARAAARTPSGGGRAKGADRAAVLRSRTVPDRARRPVAFRRDRLAAGGDAGEDTMIALDVSVLAYAINRFAPEHTRASQVVDDLVNRDEP